MKETLILFLQGHIQGVGFRPLVKNIAISLGLKGYVKNNGRGVEIALQGGKKLYFLPTLQKKLPPIASIQTVQTQIDFCEEMQTFEILSSQLDLRVSIPPIPDLALCKQCQDEILVQGHRRYFYPLINCTQCGPRFSVIQAFPYDRERTSMQPFEMCQECFMEYQDAQSRFFHAQPISCPKCSPKIFWMRKERSDYVQLFKEVAEKISQGEIICIQANGGFHLICDAMQEQAIKKLRALKSRPKKPLALMCKDIKQARQYAKISVQEERLLTSKEAPIVLLESKKTLKNISKDRLGIMLAYTPIHRLLFEFLKTPLVATSANFKGNPIIYQASETYQLTPFVLWHQRAIIQPIEDSIVQVISTQDILVIRNARGYAPTSFSLPEKVPYPMLAMGANQKSSFAFAFEDLIVVSPYIGDLNHLGVFERFKQSLHKMQEIYQLDFKEVICDLHPQYESTKLAYEMNPAPLQIQHHYAHALSVCFEYQLRDQVLSFCFDGTGYGEDGAIWGGEVMLVDPISYERVLHFKYFSLLGGERAIKEIWRNFFALLDEDIAMAKKEEFFLLRGKTLQEIRALNLMKQKKINSPQTSSVGRIFDAIAWVCGLEVQEYEGESGEWIESLYREEIDGFYSFFVEGGEICLDFNAIFDDAYCNFDPSIIATKFLNTLVELIVQIAQKDSREVVLCGGVFCNRILSAKVLKRMREDDKKCYIGEKIPPNDNGIAIGQLYFLLQRRRNAG